MSRISWNTMDFMKSDGLDLRKSGNLDPKKHTFLTTFWSLLISPLQKRSKPWNSWFGPGAEWPNFVKSGSRPSKTVKTLQKGGPKMVQKGVKNPVFYRFWGDKTLSTPRQKCPGTPFSGFWRFGQNRCFPENQSSRLPKISEISFLTILAKTEKSGKPLKSHFWDPFFTRFWRNLQNPEKWISRIQSTTRIEIK